ncbi:MAG: glycosyltransferase, partial [Gemmatimonadota bacterium]
VGGTRAHAGLFDGLAMGTESALDALVEQAGRLGLTAAVTEECYDVDVPADLERIAGELRAWPARAPRTAALLAEWGAAGWASGEN